MHAIQSFFINKTPKIEEEDDKNYKKIKKKNIITSSG